MVNLKKFEVVRQRQYKRSTINEANFFNDKRYWLTIFFNTYAVCKDCGEAHFVNAKNQMQVNGCIVRECINCNYNPKRSWA